MNRRCSVALAALMLAAAPAAMCAGAPAPGAAQPDFSGLWLPVNSFAVPDTEDMVRKLKPASAALHSAALAAGRRPEEDYGYCTPPSYSGGPPPGRPRAFFELLFSPGRVTLLDGQGMIRRLYLRDTPIPDALDQSRSGTSIARWEGQTLVVQTTGMYHRAKPLMAVTLGRNASTVERFSLKDENTLEVVTTLTAPDVLTAPAVRTALFSRSRDTLPMEIEFCFEEDASVDHETGKERFDTTPPADLPPPPVN